MNAHIQDIYDEYIFAGMRREKTRDMPGQYPVTPLDLI